MPITLSVTDCKNEKCDFSQAHQLCLSCLLLHPRFVRKGVEHFPCKINSSDLVEFSIRILHLFMNIVWPPYWLFMTSY